MPATRPVAILARAPSDAGLFGAARTRGRTSTIAPRVRLPDGTLRYQVLAGSSAFGLAGPDSDEDWRGVFQLPSEAFLGLGRPEMTIELPPDQAYWELAHFARLCLAGNPNIMELLWVDPGLIAVTSPLAVALRAMRGSFVSDAMVSSYLGWARSERIRLARGPDPAAWRPEIAAKRGSHLVRLLLGLRGVLATGELVVTLRGADRDLVASIKAGLLAPTAVVERIDRLDTECRELAARRHLGPVDPRPLGALVLRARRGTL